MAGVQVGKRIIGADAPVTVGWENIGRVEGGPIKQFVFTYFQPAMLLLAIGFWYYAPNWLAVASTAIAIRLGWTVLLLVLEWVNPRYRSWQLTWKEFATDAFYVALGMTFLRMVDSYVGDGAIIAAVQDAFDWDKFSWFTGLPLLVQAVLISMIFDFGQYWMHRAMHNWTPLWLTHAPHHHLTQLNAMKGYIGNPIELFLISIGVIALLDMDLNALFASITVGSAIAIYAHANVRANPPIWYGFFFTTIRNHSLHHTATSYEDTRCNYGNSVIFWDRVFGTYKEGESAIVGQDDRKRLSIWEQWTFPLRPFLKKDQAAEG